MALDRSPEFLDDNTQFFLGRFQRKTYKNFFFVRTVQVAPIH